MPPWDLIIVGAGPAGTSTALHLAARHPELAGRTLLLEKETFPREKFCAGALSGRGVQLLARLGLGVDVPHLPLGGRQVQRIAPAIEQRRHPRDVRATSLTDLGPGRKQRVARRDLA